MDENVMEPKAGGFVKKLLFPGFADSGSNETFRPAQAHPSDEAAYSDVTEGHDNRTSAIRLPLHYGTRFDKDDIMASSTVKRTALDDSLMAHTGASASASMLSDTDTDVQNGGENRKKKTLPSSPPSMNRQRASAFPSTSPLPQNILSLLASSSQIQIDHRNAQNFDQNPVSVTNNAAAPSEVVSSVVGYHFLDESVDKSIAEREQESQKASFTAQALATLPDDTKNESGSKDPELEEVDSMVSNMGSTDGTSERIDEVNVMAALMEETDETDELKREAEQVQDSKQALSLPDLEEESITSHRQPSPNRSSPSVKENNVELPGTKENAATSMVSAAFRRLGSGVGKTRPLNKSPVLNGRSGPSSTSVPTTPTANFLAPRPSPAPRTSPREAAHVRWNARHRTDPHQSFLLRSPGAAPHFDLNESKPPVLSPRFSQRSNTSFRISEQQQHPIQQKDAHRTEQDRCTSVVPSPFRMARGCLSFDTTSNDYRPLDIPATDGDRSLSPPPSSSLGRGRSSYRHPRSPNPKSLRHSQSWDVSSNVVGLQTYSRQSGGAYTINHRNSSSAFREPARNVRPLGTRHRVTNSLGRIASFDFGKVRSNTESLRRPKVDTQKIETERADALDLLSCLVERSIAFDNKNDEGPSTNGNGPSNAQVSNQPNDVTSMSAENGETNSQLPVPCKSSIPREVSTSEITDAIHKLREISEQQINGETDEVPKAAHAARLKVIDELLRSHTYASEMKRAALSASAWLKSVQNPDTKMTEGDSVEPEKESEINSAKLAKDGGNEEGTDEQVESYKKGKTSEKEEVADGDHIDFLSVKALLHSAQAKLAEKDELTSKLNEELSKCKAEIGRLKSAARAEVLFTSPNRSILDEESEDESDIGPAKIGDNLRNISSVLDTSEQDHGLPDASLPNQKDVSTAESEQLLEVAEAKKAAALLKAALNKANNTIRKLYDESVRRKELDERDDPVPECDVDAQEENNSTGISSRKPIGEPPIVTISEADIGNEFYEYKKSLERAHEAQIEALKKQLQEAETGQAFVGTDNSSIERLINVRMLDGENFVTDWDELAPPLPAPPDHELRSPIVASLLSQWTSDPSMRDSLLSWMDQVLEGTEPENIPPLTISNLDHQIRDGFSMHVLPLLLRRSDIHVEVMTRAHRQTSYDLAVSVSRSAGAPSGAASVDSSQASTKASNKHMMAFRASNGQNLEEVALEPSARYAGSTGVWRGPDLSDARAESVTHSSVTTPMSNAIGRLAATPDGRVHRPHFSQASLRKPPNSPIYEHQHPSVMTTTATDDVSVGSSITGASIKSGQAPGLMSALGGAFGLLSRRKQTQMTPQRQASYDDESWCEHASNQASRTLPYSMEHNPQHARIGLDIPSAPTSQHHEASEQPDDPHPYHRVVSAPPGRIGVTFVQYRGHAMVSDVAPDSPLQGWVFPSDILIAIDEMPVSGMRVRDIVKLLTGRRERQRALRVISSHDMSELTLNNTLEQTIP